MLRLVSCPNLSVLCLLDSLSGCGCIGCNNRSTLTGLSSVEMGVVSVSVSVTEETV
ncbi:hypothetical protein [Desulfosporosinus sp. Sb-LF]|uniref:hypothetical protein n=1 Tax=Desulfosporosinus sp. Sb-LF TaxID=2560027 RepID=UPI001A7EC057|nr:hypothetical protein [Desulfosporosinus sp. Sb-LF]